MSLLLRYGSRRVASNVVQRRVIRPHSQRNASRVAARIPFTQPSFPVLDSCPSPTCQCREMPPGLDIEREQSLNGSIATYAEQVLISTGKPDWTSKIEDESDAVFLRQMKKFMGRGGKYSDPFHNVLLTNTSLPPTPTTANSNPPPSSEHEQTQHQTPASTTPTASAFLLPTFEYIPQIPTDDTNIQTFIKAFILPTKLHTQHDILSHDEKTTLLRDPELRHRFPGVRKVDEILVLICGHGGRDQRCGILGPILQAEFEEKLERRDVRVLRDASGVEGREVGKGEGEGYVPAARVALISHIGGHKFAGNVIIYIPLSWTGHPLAGKGIWYGRVEPAHVEGIVGTTVFDGKVIKDHFRGGIGQDGEVLRL